MRTEAGRVEGEVPAHSTLPRERRANSQLRQDFQDLFFKSD